jgi:hypothetical protein
MPSQSHQSCLKLGQDKWASSWVELSAALGRLTCDSTGSCCDLDGREIIVASGFLSALYCGRFFGSFLRPRERATIAIDVSCLFQGHD